MIFQTKPLLRIYRWLWLAVFVFLPLLIGFDFSLSKEEDIPIQLAVSLTLAASSIIITFAFFWEKFFARLIIKETEIIWKCPLKKTRTMSIEECKYIGVQLEESHNGRPYSFVYFSEQSYPAMYKGKINKLKCKDGFIKFWYTEKLGDYLIEQLPKEKTKSLDYYRYRTAQVQRKKR